ncbi:MAG TPA: hypothetical protein VHB50_15805 [Bryobacteraceae bacterium]|nr:hypothetical protein [Bryobacteraceae bacterium]
MRERSNPRLNLQMDVQHPVAVNGVPLVAASDSLVGRLDGTPTQHTHVLV